LKEETMATFMTRLQFERQLRGWSPEALAVRAGLKTAVVETMEGGAAFNSDDSRLRAVAMALGYTGEPVALLLRVSEAEATAAKLPKDPAWGFGATGQLEPVTKSAPLFDLNLPEWLRPRPPRVEKRGLGQIFDRARGKVAARLLGDAGVERGRVAKAEWSDVLDEQEEREALFRSETATAVLDPEEDEDLDQEQEEDDEDLELVTEREEARFTLIVAANADGLDEAGQARLEQTAWSFLGIAADRGMEVVAEDQDGAEHKGQVVESYVSRFGEHEGSWLVGIVWADAAGFEAASAGRLAIGFKEGGE
jgi:transcriptional regulator with XRE-family HTH domain